MANALDAYADYLREAEVTGLMRAGGEVLPSDIARRPAWHEWAACRGRRDVDFFPARGQPATDARALCSDCPVRQDCLEAALDGGEMFGVWGGFSERQRRKLRTRKRVTPAA